MLSITREQEFNDRARRLSTDLEKFENGYKGRPRRTPYSLIVTKKRYCDGKTLQSGVLVLGLAWAGFFPR